MSSLFFQSIDWNVIEKISKPGASGTCTSQTYNAGDIRMRLVSYSAGYLADHWCQKGHIVHCISGSFTSELESGESSFFTEGMSYVVSDNTSSHRSRTSTGVKLLIIDGAFLQ